MKKTTLLSLTVTFALASMVASIGCSAAPVQSFESGDTDSTKKAATKAPDSKKATTAPTGTTTTPPAGNTTPPAGTPATDAGAASAAEACFKQCIAANAQAAAYIQCSETQNCQDQTCDDNCFNQNCQGQEQACDAALQQCDTQCPPDPNQPPP